MKQLKELRRSLGSLLIVPTHRSEGGENLLDFRVAVGEGEVADEYRNGALHLGLLVVGCSTRRDVLLYRVEPVLAQVGERPPVAQLLIRKTGGRKDGRKDAGMVIGWLVVGFCWLEGCYERK